MGRRESGKKEAAIFSSAIRAAVRPFQPEPVQKLPSIGNQINWIVTRLYAGNPGANEWPREISHSCVDISHNSQWTHSLKISVVTKNGSVSEVFFPDFVTAKKIEDFINYKMFFAKVWLIDWFVLR